jgi:hypothetical protein
MAGSQARAALDHSREINAASDHRGLSCLPKFLSLAVSRHANFGAAIHSLAKTALFRLTIPITPAGDGGSVQQRLSAAAAWPPLTDATGAADKLYSLKIKKLCTRFMAT